jgi:protein-disulfide isomerase
MGFTFSLGAGQPLIEGQARSTVHVLIFEDLQCSDCAAFRRMLDEQLLPRYASKVTFEHRDFPVAKHPWARKAAIASRAFLEINPKLALDFRSELLANIRETTTANFNERITAFATSRGVKPVRVLASLNDPKLNALVEKDLQDGIARRVSKTPTVFVNGRPFVETFSFEEVSKTIDEELARSQ